MQISVKIQSIQNEQPYTVKKWCSYRALVL